ncbi:MAG: A24 family peptidase C-terminal domain-containing protein [Methanothermobacter sp.]|nr:A24 family peptidase C-terminal domain-containing protein [Methanothermobacter sp.]
MYSILPVLVALLASLYAAYSDLKRGVIPNRLTFPLIGLGIVLDAIFSYQMGDPLFFVFALIFTGMTFIVCYIFWRLGAWAGGDVKLFTGLAALLPFQPSLLRYSIMGVSFPIIASYPFPFTLIINSILGILPFLIIFVFYIASKYKRHLLEELLEPIKDYKSSLIFALIITSAITLTLMITSILSLQIIILAFIIIYILTMMISKLPMKPKILVISAVTLYSIYQNPKLTITGILILWTSIIILQVIRKLLGKVAKEALQDEIKVEDLKEGMILAYKLYKKDNKYYFDEKSFWEKIKEAARTGNLQSLSPGKIVLSSMAAGLTREDIKLLVELSKTGKIPGKVRIKKGVPFAPAIFIGLLLSLSIGDLAILLLKVFSIGIR